MTARRRPRAAAWTPATATASANWRGLSSRLASLVRLRFAVAHDGDGRELGLGGVGELAAEDELAPCHRAVGKAQLRAEEVRLLHVDRRDDGVEPLADGERGVAG